ncbi:MAG: hypothetical protein ACJ8G7_00145 [Rhizobacter sp.]
MMDTATTTARDEQRQDQRMQQDDRMPPDERMQENRVQQDERMPQDGEARAALFAPDAAGDFRNRWSAVQGAFVDDPTKAVRDADELVNQVLKSLADSFAEQRAAFDGDRGPSTEDLRIALRRYRAFFERLLSL